MSSQFDETINAMRACMKIRDLFAHCHWARSKKRGLFFINLEEVAKSPPFDLNKFRHASSKTLAYLEDYFWYTFSMLDFLMNEFGVRTDLGLFDRSSRPRKMGVPQIDVSRNAVLVHFSTVMTTQPDLTFPHDLQQTMTLTGKQLSFSTVLIGDTNPFVLGGRGGAEGSVGMIVDIGPRTSILSVWPRDSGGRGPLAMRA